MPITPSQIKLVLAIGVIIAAGFMGYKFGHDSVMADWQTERAEVNKATSDALIKMQQQRDNLEREMKQKEAAAWEKYQNAQTESDRLSDELANIPWRVRIVRQPADCPVSGDSSTSSLDDGARHSAELPEETSRGLVAIGRDADRCEAKLSALQDWVKTLVDTNGDR